MVVLRSPLIRWSPVVHVGLLLYIAGDSAPRRNPFEEDGGNGKGQTSLLYAEEAAGHESSGTAQSVSPQSSGALT